MTSHDVRSLRQCCLCHDLGAYRPKSAGINWPIVVCLHSDIISPPDRKYAHPNCYLQEMGLRKLLSLPIAELNNIRLCDVPPRTMQAILRKLAA